MRIIDFEASGGFAGEGTHVLARFSVQVTEDLRLCGLKLVDTPKGRRTFFPSVSGGGRSVTASISLSRQITAAASIFFERHEIAHDRTAA
ncbi:hypothetical protein [Rhizobium leguminosarum]|uniref:hypothetical protein n=1 Tax=Rhizobium leguminosarum TaxID=384 RepID=UPI001C958798|nr:hypothetical protein [Rhizobium leguminosarum]MBY5349584.1 hypothetical protein [Rhizobium leguminosarum]